MNRLRAPLVALLAGLALGTTAGAQILPERGEDSPQAPADDLAAFEDGAPLQPRELEAVEPLLKPIRDRGTDKRRDAARLLLQERRTAMDAYRDSPATPIPVLEDLREHPGAYRGGAVVLWGRVLRSEPLPQETDLAQLVLRPYERKDQIVHVLVPGPVADELPDPGAEGLPVVLVADFVKLAAPADEADAVVPTFLAAEVLPLGVRLPAELLQSVQHRTRPRPEERDAYLTAIVQARLVDETRLRRAARELRNERIRTLDFRHDPAEFPTYVDLFKNPDVYHGRPVTLSGHVWAVTREPGAPPGEENAYGLDRLYSVLLYTDDSQTHPALVVCSELPEGMPASGVLEEALDNVSATGFFYKTTKYTDQAGTVRIMPVVIAETVSWSPPGDAAVTPRIPLVVYPLLALATLIVVGIGCWIGFRDRQWRRRAHRRLDGDEPPRFDDVSG